MNTLTKIKLQFYPELKKIDFDDDTLTKIINNPNFKKQYKEVIKPFIKYLHDFIPPFNNNSHIEPDKINHHLESVFYLSISNKSNDYVTFVKNYSYQNRIIDNYMVFNDANFDSLYSICDNEIFFDQNKALFNSGHSDRIIYFLNKYKNYRYKLSQLNPSLFEDKVWDIIKDNSIMGNTNLLDLFSENLVILIYIINRDLFEGLKYTYENIPESHNFIECQLSSKNGIAIQQFSQKFLENINDKTLHALYAHNSFSDSKEYVKIFQIADMGNYELINDLVSFDSDAPRFQSLSESDISKSLLELNIYNKKEVLIHKYLGIERNDIYYIKLFIDAIGKVTKLPEEFQNKYSSILALLTKILRATDEQIIALSKSLNVDNKEKFKKLIYEMETAGNEIIKSDFVSDLKERNTHMLRNIKPRFINRNGKDIPVYEFNGEPFVMLVHSITNNNLSSNNALVSKLIDNPELWDKIPGRNNHISTSLISNDCMTVYGIPRDNNTIMFGFSDIPSSSLKITGVGDLGIDRKASLKINYNMRNRVFTSTVNTVTTIDDLLAKIIKENQGRKSWSEVVLTRVNEVDGSHIMPNYIVCMDNISDTSLKAAEKLGLPIYFIKRWSYRKVPTLEEKIEQRSQSR